MKEAPSYRLEIITPQVAFDWLENRASNRDISESWVRALAQAILTPGAWKLTHQGIAFDQDGRLIDGEHRLWAIVRAGKSVPMFVARGISMESREGMDKGRKRTLRDDLAIIGRKNNSRHAAYVKHCANLLVGRNNGSGAGSLLVGTVSMLDAWSAPFEQGIEWAMGAFTGKGVVTPIAGTMAFCYRANPELIMEFGEKVSGGVDLQPGDPALTLRRNLFEQYANKNRLSAVDITVKVFSAAYAHLHGRRVLTLNKKASECGDYFRRAYTGLPEVSQLLVSSGLPPTLRSQQ